MFCPTGEANQPAPPMAVLIYRNLKPQRVQAIENRVNLVLRVPTLTNHPTDNSNMRWKNQTTPSGFGIKSATLVLAALALRTYRIDMAIELCPSASISCGAVAPCLANIVA